MEKDMRVRIITLEEMLQIFLSHLWIMLLAALIVAGSAQAINRLAVKPLYQSKATLYILRQGNEPNYIYTQSDFSLAKDVVNDCTYVIRSQDVLEDVISKLSLPMSVRGLQGRISTNNPENTRFLEVLVKGDTPDEAKKIADALCELASKKIEDSMGFDQVNLYAYGTLPDHRCNDIGWLRTGALAAMAAVLVYGIYLIVFLMDTSVQTEEDITRHLGISVLAEIPNYEKNKAHGGKKYRYRYYRNKYEYRYSYGNSTSAQAGDTDGKKTGAVKSDAKKKGDDKK